MIILHRWEPTTSPSFPSMILFWIKIQGILIHLWTEEVARGIGSDLGTFEVAEITAHSIRMRVHVNGRLPLIKTSIIENPNGDEVTATLVYEKLEKHCFHCGRLDHEIRDCLEEKHQKKERLAAQKDSKKSLTSVTNKEGTKQAEHSYTGGPNRHSPRRDNRYRPYSRNDQPHRADHSSGSYLIQCFQHQKNYQRDSLPNNRHGRDWSHRNVENTSHRRNPPTHKERGTFSGDSHSTAAPRDMAFSEHSSRDRNLYPRSPRNNSPQNNQRALESRLSPPARGAPQERELTLLTQEAMNAARGEVREVMLQYTSCADPSESAVRKERLRLAKAHGQLK
ncbi:hypothetical protein YC2023_061903 [Brassica napus]